ncbi:MAG: glycosyltransferase family 4 protein [Desulfopila sp.]
MHKQNDSIYKILQVNKFHWLKGGSEAVYFSEAAMLRKHKHKVVNFSVKNENNLPDDYDKYFIDEVDYDAPELLKKISNAVKIIYNFDAKSKIKNLLNNESFDIAHLHNFQHQISPSIFRPLKKHGIPLVLSIHDLKSICPNYKMYTKGHVCEECKEAKFYKCVLNSCTKRSKLKSAINMIEMYFHHLKKYYTMIDKFIAVSQFYKDKFIEFGFSNEKIVYIPNFINCQEFVFKNEDDGYALYFGRLAEEKGLHTLLRASALRPDIPLIVVGTGPEQIKLKKLANELNLKNVTFLGYKYGNELRSLISNASFTILASEWYENCPMSILESLAFGTPVIGSNMGGIPELIVEGIDGLTFKAGDQYDLAHKMEKLWNDKSLRESMAQYGREKIEKRFTEENHYNKLMEVYREIT